MDIVDILNILLDFILSKYFYLPIIYILVGVLIYKILKKIVVAVFNRQSRLIGKNRKRYSTLVQVIVDLIKIIIIAFVLLSILTVYGVDVKAALAGLGIVSVIVGLAFQDLFKDFIVGFTIIIEDYFSVGDTIKIGEFKGEDEQIPEQKMEIIMKELNRIDHIEFGTKEYNDLKLKIDMMRDLRGD
jgi:small-conductance mechanosensitive channel